MALPLLPLAIGAGVLGFLLLRKKDTPAASSIAEAQAGGTSLASLPPEFTAKFNQLLTDPNVDPVALDTTAASFEQAGLTTQALQLRQRAAQLRAQNAGAQTFRAPTAPAGVPAPSGPAPAPRAAPAQPPAPAPAAVAPGLPILDYFPDLGPVGSSAAGTYFPRSVDNDAQALRFLGFPAGSPGGGISRSEDVARGTGGFNPQFQDAVRSFQQTMGTLTVDGKIGPNTRQRLAEAVADTNATHAQINASSGAQASTFAGLYDPTGLLRVYQDASLAAQAKMGGYSGRGIAFGGYSGRGIAFGRTAPGGERRIGTRYPEDRPARGTRFSRW